MAESLELGLYRKKRVGSESVQSVEAGRCGALVDLCALVHWS